MFILRPSKGEVLIIIEPINDFVLPFLIFCIKAFYNSFIECLHKQILF